MKWLRCTQIIFAFRENFLITCVVQAHVFPYNILLHTIRALLMQHFLKALHYCVQDFLQVLKAIPQILLYIRCQWQLHRDYSLARNDETLLNHDRKIHSDFSDDEIWKNIHLRTDEIVYMYIYVHMTLSIYMHTYVNIFKWRKENCIL